MPTMNEVKDARAAAIFPAQFATLSVLRRDCAAVDAEAAALQSVPGGFYALTAEARERVHSLCRKQSELGATMRPLESELFAIPDAEMPEYLRKLVAASDFSHATRRELWPGKWALCVYRISHASPTQCALFVTATDTAENQLALGSVSAGGQRGYAACAAALRG